MIDINGYDDGEKESIDDNDAGGNVDVRMMTATPFTIMEMTITIATRRYEYVLCICMCFVYVLFQYSLNNVSIISKDYCG